MFKLKMQKQLESLIESVINIERNEDFFSNPKVQEACHEGLVGLIGCGWYYGYCFNDSRLKRIIDSAGKNKIILDLKEILNDSVINSLALGNCVIGDVMRFFSREYGIEIDFSTPEIQEACQEGIARILNDPMSGYHIEKIIRFADKKKDFIGFLSSLS